MDNILKQVQKMIVKKKKYVVARVVSTSGSLCIVQDELGNDMKVVGLGYNVGNNVLVEDGRIISHITKKTRRVWIP
jgi:hypothetical protein